MLEVRGHKHPIVNPRTVDFTKVVDPLDMGRWVDHNFQMVVYDAMDTETTVEMTGPGDVKLGNGQVYNDYFGFGAGLKKALVHGREMYEPFMGLSPSFIHVTVTINILREAVILADKQKSDELYFNQEVDVIRIPRSWHTTTEPQEYRGWGERIVVWQDGAFTDAYEPVLERLNAYIAADLGTDYRIRPIPPLNPGDYV